MSEITQNSVYKNAKEVPASIIAAEAKTEIKIEDINKILEELVSRQDEKVRAAYNLGKLCRNQISTKSSSNDILLVIINLYKEILQKELNYNNNIEKVEIVQNCITGLESLIKILENSQAKTDSEQFLFLLRSIIL